PPPGPDTCTPSGSAVGSPWGSVGVSVAAGAPPVGSGPVGAGGWLSGPPVGAAGCSGAVGVDMLCPLGRQALVSAGASPAVRLRPGLPSSVVTLPVGLPGKPRLGRVLTRLLAPFLELGIGVLAFLVRQRHRPAAVPLPSRALDFAQTLSFLVRYALGVGLLRLAGEPRQVRFDAVPTVRVEQPLGPGFRQGPRHLYRDVLVASLNGDLVLATGSADLKDLAFPGFAQRALIRGVADHHQPHPCGLDPVHVGV